MTGRRSIQRRRSYLGGRIAFNERHSTLSCLVRNFSEGGARLDIPSGALVPDEFDLAVPHRDMETRCRVVWRGATEVGVAFRDAGGGGSNVIPLAYARRLAESEREKASLRRRIDELVS